MNCVRALDYLETRPEIDKNRFGVTGRSGGGAYSWWIAAIDDRIKAAVPTAGITDLQNHVIDGTVEGHCDCMFMVNTYRWDYPQVAALVAPRPLLISNTDSDRIFPLDGVVRTFEKVRRIYRLYGDQRRGAENDIALAISPGPHKDTQELNTHEFRWFNHYLKGDESPIDSRAPKYFEPRQLKVFDKLPEDAINTQIHETFVAEAAEPAVPNNNTSWDHLATNWKVMLRKKAFGGWSEGVGSAQAENVNIDPFSAPSETSSLAESDGIRLSMYTVHPGDDDFENRVERPMYALQSRSLSDPKINVLTILDDKEWFDFLAILRAGFPGIVFESRLKAMEYALPPPDEKGWNSTKQMLSNSPWVLTYFPPRGVGPVRTDQPDRKQIQNRRRYYLVGQTLDGMQTVDVRAAIQATRTINSLKAVPLWLQSHRTMAGITLFASLFEHNIQRLDLYELPKSHRE